MKAIKNLVIIEVLLLISSTIISCMGPRSFNIVAEREEINSVNVLPYLNIKKGDVVADIGAGGGFFTYKFSKAVGEKGKVYSIDIKNENIEFIGNKVKEIGLTNVEVILASVDDSKLKQGTIDIVFIRNAYHDFQNRIPYFSTLKSVLKNNGKVVIIDYDPKKLGFFRKLIGHSLEEKIIKTEMEKAGYSVYKTFPILELQSFNIFVPTDRK